MLVSVLLVVAAIVIGWGAPVDDPAERAAWALIVANCGWIAGAVYVAGKWR